MKLKRILFLVLGSCFVIAMGIFVSIKQSPSIDAYKNQIGLPPTPEQSNQSKTRLRVTFLGTTSLLFDDGETAWMTDGFFSRPGVFNMVFGSVSPNEKI